MLQDWGVFTRPMWVFVGWTLDFLWKSSRRGWKRWKNRKMTTRSRQWTLRANYGLIEVIRCLPRLQVSGSFMWEVSHKLWELLRSKRWDRRWTRESHSFVSLMYKPDSKCCANSRSKRFGLMGRKGLWLDVFFFEGVKKATSPPLLFDFLDLHNTNEKYSMTNCSRIVASCQVARPSFQCIQIWKELTLLGTNISPYHGTFEDDDFPNFPFGGVKC